MIPKIIHYCWFGGNPKPELIQNCIMSWKKNCPDYEIIEWNENNYDVNSNDYVKKAYMDKKWAFVSDVARLEILYHYGGIYLDTDVEILFPNALRELVEYGVETIFCFENGRSISTGLFAASFPKNDIIKKMIEPYFNDDMVGSYEVNTFMNKNVFLSEFPSLCYNNKDQVIEDTLFISSGHYGSLMKHYGTRSWLENFPSYEKKEVPKFIIKMRNHEIFERLERSKAGRLIEPIYTWFVYDFFDLGIMVFIKRGLIKIKNLFCKKST